MYGHSTICFAKLMSMYLAVLVFTSDISIKITLKQAQ